VDAPETDDEDEGDKLPATMAGLIAKRRAENVAKEAQKPETAKEEDQMGVVSSASKSSSSEDGDSEADDTEDSEQETKRSTQRKRRAPKKPTTVTMLSTEYVNSDSDFDVAPDPSRLVAQGQEEVSRRSKRQRPEAGGLSKVQMLEMAKETQRLIRNSVFQLEPTILKVRTLEGFVSERYAASSMTKDTEEIIQTVQKTSFKDVVLDLNDDDDDDFELVVSKETIQKVEQPTKLTVHNLKSKFTEIRIMEAKKRQEKLKLLKEQEEAEAKMINEEVDKELAAESVDTKPSQLEEDEDEAEFTEGSGEESDYDESDDEDDEMDVDDEENVVVKKKTIPTRGRKTKMVLDDEEEDEAENVDEPLAPVPASFIVSQVPMTAPLPPAMPQGEKKLTDLLERMKNRVVEEGFNADPVPEHSTNTDTVTPVNVPDEDTESFKSLQFSRSDVDTPKTDVQFQTEAQEEPEKEEGFRRLIRVEEEDEKALKRKQFLALFNTKQDPASMAKSTVIKKKNKIMKFIEQEAADESDDELDEAMLRKKKLNEAEDEELIDLDDAELEELAEFVEKDFESLKQMSRKELQEFLRQDDLVRNLFLEQERNDAFRETKELVKDIATGKILDKRKHKGVTGGTEADKFGRTEEDDRYRMDEDLLKLDDAKDYGEFGDIIAKYQAKNKKKNKLLQKRNRHNLNQDGNQENGADGTNVANPGDTNQEDDDWTNEKQNHAGAVQLAPGEFITTDLDMLEDKLRRKRMLLEAKDHDDHSIESYLSKYESSFEKQDNDSVPAKKIKSPPRRVFALLKDKDKQDIQGRASPSSLARTRKLLANCDDDLHLKRKAFLTKKTASSVEQKSTRTQNIQVYVQSSSSASKKGILRKTIGKK
jgi:hypothetical protein